MKSLNSLILILVLGSVVLAEPIQPLPPTQGVEKAHEPEAFSGTFTLTVPANRLLDSMELGVEFDAVRDVVSGEFQGTENPTDMILLGSKKVITVRKDRRGRVRSKNEKRVQSSAWFYLFSATREVKTFTLKPLYYSRGASLIKTGVTDPVFQCDVYLVDRIGAMQGTLVKTVREVSLAIGMENEIGIHQRLEPSQKLAIRVFVPKNEDQVLHLPVRKMGTYPGNYLNGLTPTSDAFYNAPVRFTFTLPEKDRSPETLVLFRRLTRSINAYIRSHPKFGASEIIEVPVSLKMRLAPEGQHYVTESFAGPPPPPPPPPKPRKNRKRKNQKRTNHKKKELFWIVLNHEKHEILHHQAPASSDLIGGSIFDFLCLHIPLVPSSIPLFPLVPLLLLFTLLFFSQVFINKLCVRA